MKRVDTVFHVMGASMLFLIFCKRNVLTLFFHVMVLSFHTEY